MSSEYKLWLPPLSPKQQQQINQQREREKQLQNKQQKKHYFAWTGFKNKTLWNWLQLLAALAIPVAVAAGTLWFTAAQSQASDRASAQQHRTDLQIAQQQYQNNISIANDQQQETALQTYLDRMSDLLLNHNLRTSKPVDEVRDVANARTFTILPQLNGRRKGEVVLFLYVASLIGSFNVRNPIVHVGGDDLSYIEIQNDNMDKDEMSRLGLYGIDLSYANLYHAFLSGIFLTNAIFYATDLQKADLNDAFLNGADLRANLSSANLSKAILQNANLNYADLSGADLSGADLSGANLNYANLSGANLKGAIGVTNEQLSRATSLHGTIMPDGSTHS